MKRCPQCNRVENDDTLVYCRGDGAALISDSGSISGEAGTVRFSSGPVSGEISTSILPLTSTAPEVNRSTGPTTALPAPQTQDTTRELTKPKPRGVVVVAIGLVVIILIIAAYFYLPRSHKTAIESIAVMPFVNESGNADVEYLSDGMTETLINSLSQIPNLSVKARSSVFRYKGKEIDSKRIAAELNVQAILTGRVIQRGEQLTVNLELIDAQTENTLWGNKYERKASELVSMQTEIAHDVSGKLKSKLSGAEVANIEKNYTVNPEAYQLYLKGRFQWNKRTIEALKQAAEFFKQAIEKDPNYALAYSGLAQTYVLFPFYGIASPKASMPQAKASALRALGIDDSLAEAHAALGKYLLFFEFDRQRAR